MAIAFRISRQRTRALFAIAMLVALAATVACADVALAEAPKTFTVGTNPWGLAVSPDGSTLYVANCGDGTISILNAKTGGMLSLVPAGQCPRWVALSADGRTLYVTNDTNDAATIRRMDTRTRTFGTDIPTCTNPTQMVLSADHRAIYVVCKSRSLWMIDAASGTPTFTIAIDSDPANMALAPNGKRIYIADYQDNRLTIVDTTTKEIAGHIPVGAFPVSVAVSADSRTAYVANDVGESVSVIDTGSDSVSSTIPLQHDPYFVVLSHDSRLAYVAQLSPSDSGLAVVDVRARSLVSRAPVGASPSVVALSPDGNRIYVANWDSATVTALAIPRASQPANQTVRLGDSATFSSTVINNPDAIAWQVSTDGGKTYSAIPGATSSSYHFTPANSDSGKLYRLMVSDGNFGDSATHGATLTVIGAPTSTPAATSSAGQSQSLPVDASQPFDPLLTAVVAGILLFLAILVVVIVVVVRRWAAARSAE